MIGGLRPVRILLFPAGGHLLGESQEPRTEALQSKQHDADRYQLFIIHAVTLSARNGRVNKVVDQPFSKSD